MFSLISHSLSFSPNALSGGLLAILMLAILSAPVLAQTGTGSIQGTVSDATGSVIPGAKVTLTYPATAQTTTAVANDSGIYSFPSLPIGKYTISVEASGMKRWEGELLLQVGQSMVVDPQLVIGDVSAEVTVAGDVTEIITSNAPTIGNTLDRTRIEQLPQNGRGLVNIISQTTPGIEGARVNGMREAAFEFVQDGAPLVSRDFGGASARLPGLDTLQEVRIETNGSSAKFNRPATAILSTKSGTNQFHGSLFETHRNNAVGVARRRQDVFTTAPKLIRNEFGGSIGGPVFLPRFGDGGPGWYNGKDRTFFFVSYEGFELREETTGSFRVPTAAMRQGDFSGLITSNGTPVRIFDPRTTTFNAQCYQKPNGDWVSSNYCRTVFPGNVIPISLISPFAKALYAITPLPTNDKNPLIEANWTGAIPRFQSDKTFTGRIDHMLTQADQLFFRYSYGIRDQQFLGSANFGPPTTDGNANMTFTPASDQSGSFSWAHTISPSLFSETVVSHNYESILVSTGPNHFVDYSTPLGLPNLFKDVGFPNITSNGFSSYGQGDTARLNYQNITNIDENLTWSKGSHEVQFGGRYRREQIYILPDQNPPAVSVSFSNLATALYDVSTGNTFGALSNTGHTAADFFLGNAGNYTVAKRQQWYHFLDQEFSAYIQDNWRVTDRLTLNLGLRWEAHPALKEGDNFFSGYNEKTKSIIIGQPLEKLYALNVTTPQIVTAFQNLGVKFETPDQAGLPPGLVKSNLWDFAPRIGFAYKILGDTRPTVIRGGYAVFNYPPPIRNFYAETRFNPPYTVNFNRNYNSSAQTADGLPNLWLRSVPSVIAGLNSTDAVSLGSTIPLNRGGFGVSYLDPEYPSTKVHQWNLTFERELRENIVGRISYVASHGSNLEQYYDKNAQIPDYVWFKTTGLTIPQGTFGGVARRPLDNQTLGYIEVQQKTGESDSSSFHFEIQKRYAKGYGFQLFYALTNAFKMGGNGWRDDYISPLSSYIAGEVPTDPDELNHYLNYRRDSAIPKHRVRWNWIADIPIGKGKWLLGNANRWVNGFLGGWQFAGIGNMQSSYWQLGTGSRNTDTAPLEIYGKKYKVRQCSRNSTGVESCRDAYLWYNGYIPPSQRNQYNTAPGATNLTGVGIFGLPDNYTPAHTPLIQEQTTGSLCGSAINRTSGFWNSNTVEVFVTDPATNTQVCRRTAYNPGPHPFSKGYFLGPLNWTLDASLYKTVSITENVKLRINIDAFNVFNMPGLANPDGNTGILSTQNSASSPRVFQFTGRISF